MSNKEEDMHPLKFKACNAQKQEKIGHAYKALVH
jgi:hypothetical protein